MFKNAPLPLLVIAAIYLPVELTLTVISKNWWGLIPIALVIVLFLFTLRGSRIASFIWAVLWLLGAVGAGYMAYRLMKTQPSAAAALGAYCLFFLGSSGYLFFHTQPRGTADPG